MFDPRSVQECRAPSLSVQSSAVIVWPMTASPRKAEPDVTGVYRRVKSRKGAKKCLSNISIKKFGQQNQQNKSPTKNGKMKKVLDKETKLVYKSAFSKIVS
jgi:hypothetical protein